MDAPRHTATVPGGDGLTDAVRRRHVIYVQGYDPRGLAFYFRLFRSDYV
jgi:hypothetical protein